ncbi:MAG: TolC family protein [Candidatus Obscuribacterales bacterium]|nr:TolC family protein [Candidatus Obscuribacterales bacterium]
MNKLVNNIKSNQLLLQLKAVPCAKGNPVALLLALTVSLTTLQPIFAADSSSTSGNEAPAALSLEDSAGPIYKPSMVDPTNHLDPNSSWDYALGSTNSGGSKRPTTAKAAANKVKVAAANVVSGKTRTIAQTSGAPVPIGTSPAQNATTASPADAPTNYYGESQAVVQSAPDATNQPLNSAPAINSADRPFATPPTAGGLPADIDALPDPNKPSSGQIFTPPNLSPTTAQRDKKVIDQQSQESEEQYLQGEAIQLSLPRPNQLMSLGGTLPPIRLEANYTQPISLKDSLLYSLDNNLSIRIANANKSVQKSLAIGQFGGFLPNAIMNFQHQLLSGATVIGGIIPTSFHTPNTSAQAGFQWFGFQGGSVLFGSLSQLHQFRAAREQLHGTINDTLLAITRAYYNLVQNQALLQIQTRAVEVSRAQVVLNQQLESAGTGTKFQVLQSDTQLARDEQNLLGQEVALRNSAIDLATTLNLNQAVNFLSVEKEIRKVRLLDPNLDINMLISMAIINRPELKQYEHLRTAARRSIQIAAAPLYPQMQFYGSVNGNGATLSKDLVESAPSFTTVAVDAPSASSTIVNPTTKYTNAATTLTPAGYGSNNTPLVAAAEKLNQPTLTNRQMKTSYIIGLRVDWNYPGLGVPTAANVWAAKALARQALLNSNQQLLNVLQQVRESYLLSQTAEREIEVTTKAVISAQEELRLSRVRLANGVGTNIDVINSQRDFTTALVNKAQAIIQFNIAQAQLLHDTGLITVDTLTSGRLVKP